MQVNKKLAKAFIIICLPLASCNLLSVQETFVPTSHSPLFYVPGLIKNCSEKNQGIHQVVVLIEGEINDFSENLIKVIPRANLVTIA